MYILLIGGDKLGNITEKLIHNGLNIIEHKSNRKKEKNNFKMSRNIDLVIVLIDYVGYQLTKVVNEKCRRYNVEVLFSKRSLTYMEKKIHDCAKSLPVLEKLLFSLSLTRINHDIVKKDIL